MDDELFNIPLNRLKEAFVNADKMADEAEARGDRVAAAEHKSAAQEFLNAIQRKEKYETLDPEDIGRSALKGATQGTLDLAGVPGAVQRAMNAPTPLSREEYSYTTFDWLRGLLGKPALTPEEKARVRAMADQFMLPTGDQLKEAIPGAKSATDYKPQTRFGELTDAGTQLAPGAAVLGGANTLRGMGAAAIKLGVIPGVAGEAAADLLPDNLKQYAPLVETAGNIVGASGASVISNWARAVVNNPQRAFQPLKIAANEMKNKAIKTGDVALAYRADRIGQKAKLLNDIMDNAWTKATREKSRYIDQVRNEFQALDIRLTNGKDKKLFGLFTPDEREIVKEIANGLPVERGFAKLADASGDMKTLFQAALAAGLLQHSQTGIDDLGKLGLAAGAGAAAAKGTSEAARAAQNLRTSASISGLNETVLNQGQRVLPVRPGRLGVPTLGLYGTPSMTYILEELEDRYR